MTLLEEFSDTESEFELVDGARGSDPWTLVDAATVAQGDDEAAVTADRGESGDRAAIAR